MEKKIPMRQCMGCNQHLPKSEMIRVLRTPDGEVVVDLKGKMSGRGAYLCHSVKCFNQARKSGRIAYNLGVEIKSEVYDRIALEIEQAHG